jgi:Tfp pilus assembly protein PilO
MNMNKTWPRWKIGTVTFVGLIVLADIFFGMALWQAGREGPAEMALRRAQLARTAQELQADVERGQKIKASIPQVGKDCDDFYKSAFLDSRTVYSTVDSDITELASKTGVKTNGFTFKARPVPDRNASELDISMSVNGDYGSLLKFVNGIERSKNFYFLNQLELGEAAASGIRLQLVLHTYFRT